MGVTIMLDVSKEDVENLAQVLEFTENEFLKNFTERVLKATDEFTGFMVKDGLEIAEVDPFGVM